MTGEPEFLKLALSSTPTRAGSFTHRRGSDESDYRDGVELHVRVLAAGDAGQLSRNRPASDPTRMSGTHSIKEVRPAGAPVAVGSTWVCSSRVK